MTGVFDSSIEKWSFNATNSAFLVGSKICKFLNSLDLVDADTVLVGLLWR